MSVSNDSLAMICEEAKESGFKIVHNTFDGDSITTLIGGSAQGCTSTGECSSIMHSNCNRVKISHLFIVRPVTLV